MFDSNIRMINDIINEDGSLFSFEHFCNTFTNIKINFLEYNSIIHAVRTWIRNSNSEVDIRKLSSPVIMTNAYTVLKCHKSKFFYEILNQNSSISAGKTKWSELLDVDDREWKLIHTVPFRVTKDSRLQWFQYRIINKILATNSFLFKIKIKDSKYCNFCHSEEETIEHLLWECDNLQSLLVEFEHYLENKSGRQITFTKKSFILACTENNNNIQNTIFLWLKYYVYTARCKEKPLNLPSAISQMKIFYETQKYISYKNRKNVRFDAQWNGWNLLFT